MSSREGNRARVWLLLVGWLGFVTIPLSYFSAAHFSPLPVAKEALVSGEGGESESWRIVHVLAESCGCSRDVMAYLEEREKQDGVFEEIWLIDGNVDRVERLERAGYAVSLFEAEALCVSFGAEGVPFFQVIAPDGEVRYSGSYYDGRSRAGVGVSDLAIYEASRSGQLVEGKPVYGCPTSERLRSRLDPLGLKQL